LYIGKDIKRYILISVYMEAEAREHTECPYCNKDFEDEHERGVHISKNHVDTESQITKSKRMHDTRKNIIEDQWSSEKA